MPKWADGVAVIKSFNSLLEMPKSRNSKKRSLQQVGFQFSIGDANSLSDMWRLPSPSCFNSLLEMPIYSGRAGSNQRGLVSILYWRCIVGGEVDVDAVPRLFQFSIGDARFWGRPQEIRRIQLQFQFSIGDAPLSTK